MSRLDSAIRRLQAQRACLDLAAAALAGRPGPLFELGLGNGRTYDHLRQALPGREIYAFDRQVNAHPACIPPAGRLLLGEFADTLTRALRDFAGRVALIHGDVGSGDPAETARSAELVARLAPDLLAPGGLLLCDQPLGGERLEALPLPAGVEPGRYHIYRRR